MKVVLAGASGLIGTGLSESLRGDGHEVTRLVRVRSGESPGTAFWDPAAGELDPEVLRGVEAVVCLSGESIASGRWTASKKERLRDSRIGAVNLIVRALGDLDSGRPSVLVCASAVGYYGAQRGDEVLGEESAAGDDFLAELCKDWEAASGPASKLGMRCVQLRFGIVLDRGGGVLARMLLPFRLGLGGKLGRGDQYMSWLTLRDAVGVTRFAIENPAVEGAVNAMAPESVTNAQFTRALGRALRRPTVLGVPAVAIRLALGEMGDALLLGSARAYPEKLKTAGFEFQDPEIGEAFQGILGSPA